MSTYPSINNWRVNDKARLRALLLVSIPSGFLLAPAALSALGDLVIPRKEGSMSIEAMPPSVFPHWVHRVRYRCDACHERLFEMELGATEISMSLMSQGKSCGTCHNGEQAFEVGFNSCNRCHQAAQQ